MDKLLILVGYGKVTQKIVKLEPGEDFPRETRVFGGDNGTAVFRRTRIKVYDQNKDEYIAEVYVAKH